MIIATLLGSLFLVGMLVVTGLVVAGHVEPVTLVALVPLAIGTAVAFVIRRLSAGAQRTGALIAELPLVAVQRRGRVLDAVVSAKSSGGVTFHDAGVMMVLRVELRPQSGRSAEVVAIYVIESTEAARARIGTEVVVLEHPDHPGIRALKGFLPSGRPAD